MFIARWSFERIMNPMIMGTCGASSSGMVIAEDILAAIWFLDESLI
jgi:hypothetical protein